ncbi:MAG: TRAP transporter small permease [Spirochaetales bacterium]|nr:TRAP transporter small permease [Spirochaetales bacterium]
MFYRFLGGVIAGTYELVELMIVVSGAFSLGYTALKRGHITIGIIVSRVPQRIRIILERVTSAISLCLWTIMAWATFSIIHERWLREQSQLLQISYFPFRFALLLGLILFCIVILIDLFLAPHKEESK